jgi:hypothetical protein
MKVGYEQIFVGKEGTGSPFHHASVYNMFYMVDGQKTWWFIDPYDTFLAYPVAVLGKAAGILLCLWPDTYNKEVLFVSVFVYSSSYFTSSLFKSGVSTVQVLSSVQDYFEPWRRAVQPSVVVAQHQGSFKLPELIR